VKIASIYAHTGVSAESNLYSIKGVREAVDEINEKGGVIGKKIELVEYDNMSTPIGSKVAAEKAVKLGVSAIIGADWSTHTLAIARVAQAGKVPMVTNTSTNDEITKIGNYIFRISYNDTFQGKALAGFAIQDLHAKTAVLLTDITSDYAIGLSKAFKHHFEKLGGKITGHLTYTLNQDNFRSLAAKAAKVRPDVVFIPGYEESAVIIKELMKADCPAIPLGGDGWGSDSFYEKGGVSISQGYFAGHWSESLDTPATKAFVKKYKKNNAALLDAEVLAYDAVFLLTDAVKRAGSADREKIRDALAKTRDFKAVTGNISFTSVLGDPEKNAVIHEIINGRAQFKKIIRP